ncbi:MAG: 4'-phosphopantetheinyl transferase superfamily protein [Holosporales bacterium]|nr:4'-phosphopantetheinyl transferase superfamily protein [Holosporales bacterium]
MIIGVGTDLVDFRRISRLLRAHPDSAIKKIMRPSEVQFYKGNIELGFSKIWAYKEAVIKAANKTVGFADIEIFHLDSGLSQIRIINDEQLREYASRVIGKHIGCGRLTYHATLTDELPYISAVCIIEIC